MFITQTPLRISFLGGGTDYPAYFTRHGGETLATSINTYTTIIVNRITRFVDYRIRVHYSRLESVKAIDEIQHPSARECLRFLGIDGGLEIHYVNELPARTGLGSSSSSTVGLLLALHAFKGEMVSKEELAKEAVYVEQECIKERVGSQDQYTCAVGGFLHLEFEREKKVNIHPLKISPERKQELQEYLMLFYTGMQRDANEILDEQVERTRTGQIDESLTKLKSMVKQGVEILASERDIAEFGGLLHEGWLLKRGFSSRITNPLIEEAYEKARAARALGGKLLGAGGGGFLLLIVRPQDQQKVRSNLSHLFETKFLFENIGAHIIFSRP